MANITEYGYQSIRQHVLDSWQMIELQEEDGTPIKRIAKDKIEVGRDPQGRPIYADVPGPEITGDETTQEITYKVVVSGGDEEFLGKTVAKVALFDEKTGGEPIAVEEITSFTFENEGDELTVNFVLEVPQVI